MHCPKCTREMEKVTHGGVEVDRCTGCHGIWFDLLEREKLTALEDSKKIDPGSAEVGANWNVVDRIDCPKCGTRMARLVDPQQRHVWYEACETCNGIFLDAGEFRDLKSLTLLDRLRDLLSGGRR